MYDAHPCGPHAGYRDGRSIYYCPLWGGDWIPVYETTYDPSHHGMNKIVGYITSHQNNWFWCQTRGGWYGNAQGQYSYWWAHTKADNLAVGYVPVFYFLGGGNDEPDRTLRYC